jgi:hypothetical protein
LNTQCPAWAFCHLCNNGFFICVLSNYQGRRLGSNTKGSPLKQIAE